MADSDKKISIKHNEFVNKTNGIKNANKEVVRTTKGMPVSGSSRNIRLKDYERKIQSIAALINSYCALVTNDVNDIVATAATIEQADREASQIWKIVVQK